MVARCVALSSKVALVSGANKGIGKEIVRLLSQSSSSSYDDDEEDEGWIIFLGSRDRRRGEDAVKELSKDLPKNIKIICCPLDLTDESTIQATKEMVETQGNGGKLDVLINNAAICFNDPTLYGKVPYTPFEQQANITVQTNFFGTLKVTQTMLPLLQESDSSPRIINIASSAGRLGILKSKELFDTFTSSNLQLSKLESLLQTFVKEVENGTHASKGWPNTCYGMSKLGIIALTKILAREYPTIMVNSVDPGYCCTDQNNNQGILPATRGAVTPVLLAKLPADTDTTNFITGRHFFQEREIEW